MKEITNSGVIEFTLNNFSFKVFLSKCLERLEYKA